MKTIWLIKNKNCILLWMEGVLLLICNNYYAFYFLLYEIQQRLVCWR